MNSPFCPDKRSSSDPPSLSLPRIYRPQVVLLPDIIPCYPPSFSPIQRKSLSTVRHQSSLQEKERDLHFTAFHRLQIKPTLFVTYGQLICLLCVFDVMVVVQTCVVLVQTVLCYHCCCWVWRGGAHISLLEKERLALFVSAEDFGTWRRAEFGV